MIIQVKMFSDIKSWALKLQMVHWLTQDQFTWLQKKASKFSSPLRGPKGTSAEKVSNGARRRKFSVSGVEHHAKVLSDDSGLSAVLHLNIIAKT